MLNTEIEQVGILECEYGPGKPMAMRQQEAPLALIRDSVGHQIYQEGMSRITGVHLPLKGRITEDEATGHNFSFLQLAGVMAGDSKKVANVSEGLTWDRETPLEESAKKLLLRVGGEDIVRMARYGYKWVAFIETDTGPEEFYDRFINVPTEVWREDLPENIAEIQSEIQTKRAADVGTRQWFIETFNDRNSEPLKQAFQKDDKRLFSWDGQVTEEDLGAMDADGVFISMTIMALSEDTDENARLMLLEMINFLKGTSGRNRFWIEFNYGPDAVCCNASTNAQYSEANFYRTPEFWENTKEIRLNQLKIFGYDLAVAPFLQKQEQADICDKCKRKKAFSQYKGCSCS